MRPADGHKMGLPPKNVAEMRSCTVLATVDVVNDHTVSVTVSPPPKKKRLFRAFSSTRSSGCASFDDSIATESSTFVSGIGATVVSTLHSKFNNPLLSSCTISIQSNESFDK